MTTSQTSFGVKLVSSWSRLYTVGLPDGVRSGRRDEIASDLYEQSVDNARCPSLEVLLPLIRGIPDDLAWRTSKLAVGWWLAEFAVLVAGMMFCGIVGVLSTLYITGLLAGMPAIVLGTALGASLGLWMAIALRDHRPLDLSAPKSIHVLNAHPEGDFPMTRSFRTYAGISAIVAGVIQIFVFAAYATGADINPWAAPATMLTEVDANNVAWGVMTLGWATIPFLLVPVFVVLATDSGSAAPQWGFCATVLVAIHAALNAVAFGFAMLLIPLASDFASAAPSEQVSLLQQTELVQHVWQLFRGMAGAPLVIAMFVAAFICFRARVFPRWLGVVAVVLGLQFVPPLGGEFILEPPAMAAWALGTGFILLRRSGPSLRSSTVAATESA